MRVIYSLVLYCLTSLIHASEIYDSRENAKSVRAPTDRGVIIKLYRSFSMEDTETKPQKPFQLHMMFFRPGEALPVKCNLRQTQVTGFSIQLIYIKNHLYKNLTCAKHYDVPDKAISIQDIHYDEESSYADVEIGWKMLPPIPQYNPVMGAWVPENENAIVYYDYRLPYYSPGESEPGSSLGNGSANTTHSSG